MSTKNVAAIVAHPDDEVLAFGGTMCRHVDEGDNVSVLILATGLTSRTDSGSVPAAELSQLRDEAREANSVLGVTEIEFDDFPDNQMDTVALLDVVKRVQKFIDDKNPEIVYTHNAGDLNVDHTVVARAVLTACRPLPGSITQKIYAGEILSSTEYGMPDARFVPTTYVGIEAYLDRKREALKRYRGELRYWPHPRSIKAVAHLARLRGSESGMDAAEGLCLIREIYPFTSGQVSNQTVKLRG